ncbi:unnamed protein product [Pleuronectes platessa]|uniref:Uncharacterized protein n=1 Tax=Pleuronectes platessa TaxID=8262 RepID=A0A9N7UL81_PLEPL|nr:unnamed protein product [Pleuronectes platessa]
MRSSPPLIHPSSLTPILQCHGSMWLPSPWNHISTVLYRKLGGNASQSNHSSTSSVVGCDSAEASSGDLHVVSWTAALVEDHETTRTIITTRSRLQQTSGFMIYSQTVPLKAVSQKENSQKATVCVPVFAGDTN